MDQRDRYADAESGPAVSNEFHIGGNVGAIATGQYGQATGNVYGSANDDPLEMIDRLLRKLQADASQLGDEQGADVLDDAQRLHTEVHNRRPSAESIRLMLARLAKATSSTASLLATVEQIKDLISAILH
jgi:phage shock protein A